MFTNITTWSELSRGQNSLIRQYLDTEVKSDREEFSGETRGESTICVRNWVIEKCMVWTATRPLTEWYIHLVLWALNSSNKIYLHTAVGSWHYLYLAGNREEWDLALWTTIVYLWSNLSEFAVIAHPDIDKLNLLALFGNQSKRITLHSEGNVGLDIENKSVWWSLLRW